MEINSSIFKAYDVRGIYPSELDENTALAFGKAFATFIKRKSGKENPKVVIGSDMRLSSPTLKENLIEGVLQCGVDVVDIGLVSTPTFYFGVSFCEVDGGVQVSASHNPKDYNGFKVVGEKAGPISEDTGLLDIKKIIEQEDFAFVESHGQLSQQENIVASAVQEQMQEFDITRIKKFKIVIDASNGMGGSDMKEMFAHLPSEVVEMNFTPDGAFPGHEADPMKEGNMVYVQEAVKKENADFGICLDGDGDRYFFVDEKGRTVPQSIIRGLLAQYELVKFPGSVICYDVRPGKVTKDMIEEAGGKPVLTRVGHSLIKESVNETGAVFAGESSGHFIYRRRFGIYEMPTVLILSFITLLSTQEKKLSEIVDSLNKYFNSGEINTKLESREIAKEKIAEIKSRYSDGVQMELDGLSVEYEDVWFNIRPSNTEPLLRLIVEGKEESRVKEVVNELLEIIRG